MDELKYLNDDERAHFAKWDKLFQSEGWELLKEELQKELDEGPAQYFLSAKTFEELLSARARIQTVAQLVAYDRIIALRKENLMHQRREQEESRRAADHEDY
jgi:hypothetical protein